MKIKVTLGKLPPELSDPFPGKVNTRLYRLGMVHPSQTYTKMSDVYGEADEVTIARIRDQSWVESVEILDES